MCFEKACARGAICLLDSTDIAVKNNLTAVVKIHKTFEITSDAGQRFTDVIIPVNDFVEAQNIKAYTELPGGKKIYLTRQEIGTFSAPGYRGFGGTQAIMFSLRAPTPGSKIYYEYKLNIKSLLYLPRITRRTDFATNRLIATLRWDKKVNIQYDCDGFEIFPGERSLKFIAVNLPEIPDESWSCSERRHLSICADRFKYGKTLYKSTSWPQVGAFFANLSTRPLAELGELSELSARLAASSLTRSDTLAAFFDFLADSVSYVALQIGKGDFTPHGCDIILSRRFGDCKDQSILLTALCRSAGFTAYPALIYTGRYPDVGLLHPWPAWFDHVVTVVRSDSGDIILDPSDPLAAVNSVPPRLRGKSYLVCDSLSALATAPLGPDPAFGLFWEFRDSNLSSFMEINFIQKYSGDAALVYSGAKPEIQNELITLATQNYLRDSGWSYSGLKLSNIYARHDSIIARGRFNADLIEYETSRNLAIASPLSAYLLENIFSDVRSTDFCRGNSFRLEETIIIDIEKPGIQVGSEYSESWNRQGFSFKDEMVIDHGHSIYHRLFTYNGQTVPAGDFNSFRDFLLSRKNQQYVRFLK